MSELKIKNADLVDKFFGTTGLGNTGDPYYNIPANFFLEIQKGNVFGHTTKTLRGHNSDIGIGTEDVWGPGAALVYLAAAETMEIASTDDEDGGAGTDTGALTLLLEGVDGTGAYISESITLNGTTNVTSVNSYLRVNSLTVLTAGSVGWNIGIISATATTAATVQNNIGATEGLSQNSHYTIPLATTGYIVQVELNCSKISGGANPEVVFKGLQRPLNGAWLQLFDKKLNTNVTDEVNIILPFPVTIPARSDFKFTGTSDTLLAEVRTQTYLIQVDD